MWQNIKNHPIRFFALICVAATASFLCYMAVWLTNTLSSSDWCGKAIQAERISPGNTFVGLTSCVDLLKVQLQATAMNSHIVIGSFAFCLVVLVVIVIAGARAAGKLPGGVEFDISREPASVKVVNSSEDAVPVEVPKP